MQGDTTTIKLSKKTKERLDNLKEYKNETYEEILLKMIDILNLLKSRPQQAIARLAQLDQIRKERSERLR